MTGQTIQKVNMTDSDLLMEIIKQVSTADPSLRRRAAVLYHRYQRWAKRAPGKPAGSNADANRRPRSF